MISPTLKAPTAEAGEGFVLANGLVLAEFDIDKGGCVRAYYPKASSAGAAGGKSSRPIGVDVAGQAEYFANHMLPDGAEKLTVGRTVFIVNRPSLSAAYVRFPVFAFTQSADGRWQRWSTHATASAYDVLMLDKKAVTLSVRFHNERLVDAMPVAEDGVVCLSSMPPEVVHAARETLSLSSSSSAGHGKPPSSSSLQPEGGDAAASAAAIKLGFVVAKSRTDGRSLGLLLSPSQRDALFAELAKAFAPPTPPRLSLFAFEEEAPHSVTHSQANEDGVPGAPPADDEALTRPSGGGGGGDHHHVDPVAAADVAMRPVKGASAVVARVPPAELSATVLATSSPSVVVAGGCDDTSSGTSSPGIQPGSGRRGTAEENSGEVLYGLCAVVSRRDSTARRGGRTKAVAVLGPSLAWLEPFFPALVEAAKYCCDIPGHDADAVHQQYKVLKLCYGAVNAAAPMVAAGVATTSRLSAEVARYSTLSGTQEGYVTYYASPFGTTHKTRIPLAPTPHDIALHRYSLEGLIEAVGPSFLHLVKAIMTEKRIVVLSRMGLSTDVAEAALALGTLGSTLDPTFIAQKVFPYTSISSVELFASLPGYVIGTLNPIFENEKMWHWDVLCDLDKHTVVLGERETGFFGVSSSSGSSGSSGSGGGGGSTVGGGGGGTGGSSKRHGLTNSFSGVVNSLSLGVSALSSGGGVGVMADLEAVAPQTAQFFKDLMSSMYRMRALRIPPAERNRRLHLTLEEFMQTAIVVTYAQDHFDTGAAPWWQAALKDVFMNPVMNTLCAECRLTSLMDNVQSAILFPGESPTLFLHAATLRRARGLDTAGLVGLLQAVTSMLSSDDHVRLFLRRMTVAVGGLNPVSMQLTHPSLAVRSAAYKLLARLDRLPEGKAAVAAMSSFLILVYEDSAKRNPPRSSTKA